MSPTQTVPVGNAREVRTVLPSQAGIQHAPIQAPASARTEAAASEPLIAKRVGYGLPCARCKTYYAANLAACPVCKGTDRVPAIAAIRTNTSVTAETLADPRALEEERERFLREFKSQAHAASLQLGPTAAHCTLDENHQGTQEAATVCQDCYDQLQERVDVLEAVLHMDVKEAAEVIYDAVWSDPSDPSKTYLNAAQAVLSELKRRSGITQVFGPLQPLPH
jgi:hypothetical protein